jgi:hypothetical protein
MFSRQQLNLPILEQFFQHLQSLFFKRIMLGKVFLSLLLSLLIVELSAQQFKIDTLRQRGPEKNMINLVVMGDGYTVAEMEYLKEDTDRFVEYLFQTEPFDRYENYFNVYLIYTISEESGVTHPCTGDDCPRADHGHDDLPHRFNEFPKRIAVPQAKPNTIFGSSFDTNGIHRLVVPTKPDVIRNVLKEHIPNYTQVVILANSPFYGGSGGEFATATVNFDSNDIAVHEIGHSFGELADEYWAGNMYAVERANRSQNADPDSVPWKHWVGINDIGVYSYGAKGSRAQWFRPHEFCKMQYLVAPFCSVCQEVFVETIHRKTSAILETNPTHGETILMAGEMNEFTLKLAKPKPNTLDVKWYLNDQLIAANTEYITLDKGVLDLGRNELRAVATDTTTLVRNPKHYMNSDTVSWVVQAPTIYPLSVPESTWGDTLQTCYNGFQAISVKSPQAAVQYNWYATLDSQKPILTSHNFVTPRLKQSTTFYVESVWKNKRSERKAIYVEILPPIPLVGKVHVKRNRSNGTVEFRVAKSNQNYRYVWTNRNGDPIYSRDAGQIDRHSRNPNKGVLLLQEKDILDGVFVHLEDNVTTCRGERLEILVR